MMYAKITPRGGFYYVSEIVDTTKTLSPPRYVLIDGITPQPQVDDYYNPETGNFSSAAPQAVRNAALNGVITALEDAGLVTRTF